MLFNSPEFLVFLLVALAGAYGLGRVRARAAIGWLTVCSLFFYGWWNPPYLALIGGSIVFNYLAGRVLSAGGSRVVLGLAVAANLAAIGYFKYCNFFLSTAAGLLGRDYHLAHIVLPLGISFYTFQQIAYLVDVYRHKTSEGSLVDYALFVSFFPQLIAGPIVHHKELLPQFKREGSFSFHSGAFHTGLTVFLLGLFKKVVVADGVAPYANAVFAHADGGGVVSFFDGWGGALAYTVQLYYDFSGYSDMAIGLGLMFNIHLPLNFNSPYRKTSIIDFWRSWHMTLSRFLRDYLYYPLGGNRNGRTRRYANLMATMLLGGLWHGAAWNFVFWGGLHGLYLLINHAWRAVVPVKVANAGGIAGRLRGASYWLATFLAVCIGWVFFRAETFSGAFGILRGMAGLNGFALPAELIALIPGADTLGWLQARERVPLLGGGTILGLVEQCGMTFTFLAVAVGSRNLHEITTRRRLVLLALTFAFTLQRVFFSVAPSEFIYFQF